jgi:hypothetical protein
MKLLASAAPLFLLKLSCAQTPTDYHAKKIEFGFSSATFSGSSVNYISTTFLEKKDLYSYLPITRPNATYSNFGWKQGLFIWVNLSERFSYKAQCDLMFGINQYKNLKEDMNTYCKFFGIEYKPQLVIRLGKYNTSPVIKMARDMSYYLTGRQCYLVIGPKFTYAKPDKFFLRDNDIKYNSVGMVMGYGVDNLFPNLELAPELLVSAEYKTGRRYGDPYNLNRYYLSLSLAVNFF